MNLPQSALQIHLFDVLDAQFGFIGTLHDRCRCRYCSVGVGARASYSNDGLILPPHAHTI